MTRNPGLIIAELQQFCPRAIAMTHSATCLLTDRSVKSPLQSSGLTSAVINRPGCVSSCPKQRVALRLRPASVEPPPEKLPRASRLVSVGPLPAEPAAAAPLQPVVGSVAPRLLWVAIADPQPPQTAVAFTSEPPWHGLTKQRMDCQESVSCTMTRRRKASLLHNCSEVTYQYPKSDPTLHLFLNLYTA